MYSTIVTGAEGLPSTLPCCGIPRRRAVTSAAPERVVVVALLDEPPRVSTTARTAATAIAAIAPPAASTTRGEAWRAAPLVRTGGGAATCRWRRLCFPLGISGHGSSGRLDCGEEK